MCVFRQNDVDRARTVTAVARQAAAAETGNRDAQGLYFDLRERNDVAAAVCARARGRGRLAINDCSRS